MSDWYYHDPAQGRVGPLTAEQLRTHYSQRRLQRDTLVWHDGMREWQPLERCSEELQLDGVVQDTSQPPPLPPLLPSQAQATRTSASGYPAQPRTSAPPRQGLSGCAIAAIVLAVVAVLVVGILAAIAIPAYQDYTIRAKLAAGMTAAAPEMQQTVVAHLDRHGRCPGNRDLPALMQIFAGQATTVQFGALGNGNCAFEFTVRGIAASVEGKTWLYELHRSGGISTWDCTGGDLPARYRPQACRTQ